MMTPRKSLITFIAKALLFTALLYAADYAIGLGFRTLKDAGLARNPENMWMKSSFVIEKVDADLLIIGSSKASHHYLPSMLKDSLGLSAYNCGQDGCFFLYQNCLIHLILDRYSPKQLVWDIQPGSLAATDPSLEYQNLRFLSPYYPENPWVKTYIDGESAKMKYRMQSAMFAYNSKLVNYLIPLVISGSTTEQGYLPLPNEGYSYPEMNTLKPEDTVETPMQTPLQKTYLDLLAETLERCRQKGVKVHLFISPEYRLKKANVKAAAAAIEQTAAAHQVKCSNYHSDSFFLQHATLFMDPDHLNDRGARLFTQRVIEELKK